MNAKEVNPIYSIVVLGHRCSELCSCVVKRSLEQVRDVVVFQTRDEREAQEEFYVWCHEPGVVHLEILVRCGRDIIAKRRNNCE